ncbi:MAG: type I methionyl aminopeptidase [Phycisphaerae bacterium]|nr:type I methionyl aminopeptidase [Phycisphaerae bacterium]
MKAEARQIVLKSRAEIEKMRASGRLVHQVLQALAEMVRPGVSTAALNDRAATLIQRAGATPLFLGVRNPQARFPFPAVICASVNEEIVHGVPDDRPLQAGDIVSVDCGVRLNGYCGDSAYTYAVGKVSGQTQRLLNATQEALTLAISEMRPYERWSRIARKIQAYVEKFGYGVVREFVGHGIGREMHEEPKVPNYFDRSLRGSDFELLPGMVLAVEPMVTGGRPDWEYRDRDRWSVVTKDRSLAAHYEHTVAVTENGIEILTDGK